MTDERFTKVPHWLIDESDLDLQELAVYIVLLRHRDPETGKCWPGMATIADKARMSRRTVMRVIARLEAKGIIQVERRSTSDVNDSNLYTVSVVKPKKRSNKDQPARGSRIPKRTRGSDAESPPSDSESLGTDSESWDRIGSPERHANVTAAHPSDSESWGSDSESPALVTPSHPKKTQGKKIQEEDVTRILEENARSEEIFSFDITESRATDEQVAYLRDLAIQLTHNEPDEQHLRRWRKLTRSEATQMIKAYLRNLGRPDEHLYLEPGSIAYEKLSAAGRAFAESAGRPDSVWAGAS